MTKSEIRKQIAAQRPDFQTLELLSKQIVKKFRGLELFQKARTIGVYIPLPDEVDITPLFGSAGGVALPVNSEQRGGANSPSEPPTLCEKQFFIPAFDERTGLYRLAKLTPELRKGKFGIPEPSDPVFAERQTLDLIIVPGVAFDRAGHRIGRGGGFYDRLLPQYQAVRAGIFFDFQCLESVPSEDHDCTIDYLITESEFLNLR